MYADFKCSYVRRDDKGYITAVEVSFFEGSISAQLETGTKAEGTNLVTKYRRSGLLGKQIYTDKDFGKIKTDTELNSFVKDKLKDKYPLKTLLPELGI